MKTVFIVQHSYELDSCEETKFIGAYSTIEEAEAAVVRLRKQPGFIDRPNDFHINDYEINKDHWTEGYSTVSNIQVKNKEGNWITICAVLLGDGNYEIIENQYEDDSENEFQGNDIVRCEKKEIENVKDIFAVELIRKGKSK
jgi:hypothetical protein